MSKNQMIVRSTIFSFVVASAMMVGCTKKSEPSETQPSNVAPEATQSVAPDADAKKSEPHSLLERKDQTLGFRAGSRVAGPRVGI